MKECFKFTNETDIVSIESMCSINTSRKVINPISEESINLYWLSAKDIIVLNIDYRLDISSLIQGKAKNRWSDSRFSDELPF